jgi:PAS domain S-box-containing protein
MWVRLALGGTGLGLLAILFILGFVVRFATDEMRHSALQRNDQIARRAAEEIRTLIAESRADLERTADIVEILGSIPPTKDARARSQVMSSTFFDSVVALDAGGKLIADGRQGDMDPALLGPKTRAMAALGREWTSGVEPGPRGTAGLIFVMPADHGVALIARFSLEAIWHLVDDIDAGPGGSARIVAADGTLVAGPDKNAVLRGERFALPGPAEQKGVLLAAAPVESLGWTLYLQQPVDEAFRPISVVLRRSLLFMYLTLVLTALLSSLVSMLYSRSLDALLMGTLRIADGDFEWRIDERASDEFGLLSRSFNDMVRRLRERTIALEDSQWRYRRITESVRDIIFSLDAAGRVVFLNARVETLLGVPREGILGKTIPELFAIQAARHPGGTSAPLYDPGSPLPREITVLTPDGDEVILELEGERGGGSGGDFHGIARDITQRRRMEEKLRRSEKLAALGEVASRVAHELRNAVAGITASMEMARARNSVSALAADLDLVLSEAVRAQDIVQGLLGSSKPPRVEKQPCSLNDAILSVMELRKARLEAAGIQVDLALSPYLPSVPADPGHLRQVFHNLIDNAERALRTLPAGSLRRLSARSWGVEGRVYLEIADTGPGIAQRHIGRVFDPFFTTEAEKGGTGLGLAVSLAIVESFGGDISARGRPGEGAAFTVELPILAAWEASVRPESGRELAGKRILVVEDEPAIREFVHHFMASMGSIVDSAANGQEAVALLAGGSSYELVISDFQMPDRDGRDLYEWIRASRPGLLKRLIYITGDTMNPRTRAFLEATGVPYLLKPVVASVLAAEVHRAMTGPRGGMRSDGGG